MMKKRVLLFVCFFIIVVSGPTTFSGEVISIVEQELCDTPAMLPRYTDTPWGGDFRDNPALLSLDTPYRLILDEYYTGGLRHRSTDLSGGTASFNLLGFAILNPGNTVGFREMDYYAHRLAGDTGFAMRLAEGTNAAFLFTYRWDHLSGDGEFANDSLAMGSVFGVPFDLRSSFAGTTDQRLDAHTFGASLFLSREVHKDLTLGVGLKYSFRTETSKLDESGFGNFFSFGPPVAEYVDVSRDLTIRTHEIAPLIGVRYRPAGRITLAGSLELGFAGGSVSKDSSLFDNQSAAPPYTEDLDSDNLFGWRIEARLRPELALTDNLSIPFVFGASYKDLRWSVDGAGIGDFAPINYLDVYYGEGPTEYENDVTAWELTAGAGLKYRAGWGSVSGLLSYSHIGLRDARDQENFDMGFGTGLTALAIRDTEVRDVLSLAVRYEREFFKGLSADVGLRYDLGWAQRDYYLTYSSEYESEGQLLLDVDGRDAYQDLTLSASLTMSPLDGLSLVLGGMMRAPLDPLDYELEGAATGFNNVPINILRFQANYNGPHARETETTGWDWGGWFYLTYELGTVEALPPAAPGGAKISPTLTPMGMR